MSVYMIRNDVDGLVKIGWSANVAARITQPIALTGHANLVIIRIMETKRWVESWLHRQFSTKRVSGEWFEFDDRMLTIESPEEKPLKDRRLPRTGMTMWFPDVDGDLLRAVAKAEDRPIQWVMSRALRRYAETSPEYQATALAGLTRVARKRSAASGGNRS